MSRTTRSSRTSARSPSRATRTKEESEEEEVVVVRPSRTRSTSRSRAAKAAAEPAAKPTRGRSTSRSRRAAATDEAPPKKETKRRNDGFDPKTAADEPSSKSRSRARTRSQSRERSSGARKSSTRKTKQDEDEEDQNEETQVVSEVVAPKSPARSTRSSSRGRRTPTRRAAEADEAESEAEGPDADDALTIAQAVIDSESATLEEVEETVSKLEAFSHEVQEELSRAKSVSRRGTRQTRELEDKLDAIVAAASAAQHKAQSLQPKLKAIANMEIDSDYQDSVVDKVFSREPPVALDSSFYAYASITTLLYLVSQFIVLLSHSAWLRDNLAASLNRAAMSAGVQHIITPKCISSLTQPSMTLVTRVIVVAVIQLVASFPLKYWAVEKQGNSAVARRFVRYVTSLIGSILAIGIWLHFNAKESADSYFASRAILVYLFAFYAQSLVAHADGATWPHVAECTIQIFAASACLFMDDAVPQAGRPVVLVLFLRACALAVQSIGFVGLFALTNRTAVSRGMTAVAYACSYLYLFVIIVTPLAVIVRGFGPSFSVKYSEAFSAIALIGLNSISLLDDATPANSATPFSE